MFILIVEYVEILRDRDGMSWEEADEYAQFNITNVWVGRENSYDII